LDHWTSGQASFRKLKLGFSGLKAKDKGFHENPLSSSLSLLPLPSLGFFHAFWLLPGIILAERLESNVGYTSNTC
jgi:hypothetical protein